jgi:uncharacterized protein
MTRAAEVDTVRGLALLGICVVNVPFLAQPLDQLLARQQGWDLAAQLVVAGFFQGKFFVLFSFLFGWGFAVQMASAERRGVMGNGRFLRRLVGLALIGIAHATLVFHGDILILYALLGLPLLTVHRASPHRLVGLAACGLAIGAIALFVLAASFPDIASLAANTSTSPGYRGGFLDSVNARTGDWPTAFAFNALFNGPIAFAAFCAGLAAFKAGFFERDNAVYLALRKRSPILLAIGLPLNLLYALSDTGDLGDGLPAALAFAGLAVGGPALSAVYLVGAVELARRGRFQGATVAAGRLSLTTYVLEGVLAGLVFNGYGLGLYGTVGAAGCLAVALAVYATTHAIAAIWLRVFTQGPLEQVLRVITGPGQPAPAQAGPV